MSEMTIGTLAHAAGVGVETVRFYERKGLVAQPMRPKNGGYRTYPEESIERIRFIREAQDIGFSLTEIAGLLSLRTDPASDCGQVQALAEEKRAAVIEKITKLKRILAALDQLIEACPGSGNLSECSILEALSDRDRQSNSTEG